MKSLPAKIAANGSVRSGSWVVGAMAALAAAALGAAGLGRAAWLFLGCGVAVLGGAAFLSFRQVVLRLNDIRTTASGARLRDTTQDHTLQAQTKRLERRTKNISLQLKQIRKQVKHLPYVNVELARRHQQLINDDLPMPVLGANWAATAPTVLFIVDEVLGNGRRRLLECGSGASTVWTAAALRARGDGHVYSLENDKHFAEQTRENLRAHGLENWATVVDAPLVDCDVPGFGVQQWYELAGLEDERGFDALFVDGPPGSNAPLSRYPAMPMLISRLGPGAIVVLDDTHRAPEQRIVKQWSKQGAFERPISIVKRVGQSTVLQVG